MVKQNSVSLWLAIELSCSGASGTQALDVEGIDLVAEYCFWGSDFAVYTADLESGLVENSRLGGGSRK